MHSWSIHYLFVRASR